MVSPGTGGSFRHPFRTSRARVGGERVRSRPKGLCLLPSSSLGNCPVWGGEGANRPTRTPGAPGGFFPLE
eukprot:297188-Heterocapsa_arctica.AAC.1